MFAVSELSQRTLVSVKLHKPQPKKAAGCRGTLWECFSVSGDRTGLWALRGPHPGLVGRGMWDRAPAPNHGCPADFRKGAPQMGRRAGGGPDAAGDICVSLCRPGQPSFGWQLAGLLIESVLLGSAK